jgi:PAS domain S-box-containing protein
VEAQKLLRNWIGKYHTAYQYFRISLYDTQGIRRMAEPQAQAQEPTDPFIAQNIAAILREGKVVFQDFHRNTPNDPIHLAVLVPIHDEAGDSRPLGILVLNIDPATYLYPSLGRWPFSSKTAEILLVRKDGDDVLFLNEVKFHKNAPLNLRVPLTKTDVPTVKAVLGHRGIVQGVGYDGAPVTAAVLAVPDSPWFLAAKINIAEEYEPVKKRMMETLVFVGVLLLSSALAIGFVWRDRSSRFYREQYEAGEELRKTQESLLKSEERWKFALEGSGDGVWDWNIQTGEAHYSKRYKEMLGFTESEIGDSASEWSSRVHPEDLPGAMEILQSHLDGKTPSAVIEFRMLRKDGSWQWTLSRGMVVTCDADGKPLRLVGTNTDLTERRAVEELTPDIFYSIDLQGALQRWNHSLQKFCGLSPEQMKGRSCLEFVCEEDRPIVVRDIQKVLTDGSAINTYRFIRGDGVLVPFHCNGMLILNSSGEPSGFVGFGRDISELQEKERLLSAAKEQAESATKLKDKFVEMVAHDLRSPFTSMLGLLKHMVEHMPHFEVKENQDILDRIFKSGDRMIETIDDLLKIQRFQTGHITPQSRFFKAHTSVAVTIASLGHTAAQKGIEIINEVPVGTRLYADQSLFDEVLLNLLSNAIKFCSSGDTITFFVPPGLRSAIAIRDTGKGIHEERISNLFRHEVTTTTPGTAGEMGTGLGLPNSNAIMVAHGGGLAVESELGKGTVFCATLPYVKPVALIVDDDELTLAVFREHLDNIGVDTVLALDGEMALKALKDKHPHIIVTDVKMPKMDGFALLALLKKDSSTSGIPVIVMTANDGAAREKALMLGADDFVGKPIAVDEFIPRIRRFVG